MLHATWDVRALEKQRQSREFIPCLGTSTPLSFTASEGFPTSGQLFYKDVSSVTRLVPKATYHWEWREVHPLVGVPTLIPKVRNLKLIHPQAHHSSTPQGRLIIKSKLQNTTVTSLNNHHGNATVKQTLEPDCLPRSSSVTWANFITSLGISLWSGPSRRVGGRIPWVTCGVFKINAWHLLASAYQHTPFSSASNFLICKMERRKNRSVFLLIHHPGWIKCQFWETGIFVLS